MNETTTTKKSEFVFRRLAESFDQFCGDVLNTFVLNVFSLGLLGLLALAVVGRVTYRFANPASREQKTGDATVLGIVWGVVATLAAFALLHESALLVAAVRGQELSAWRGVLAATALPVCLGVEVGVGFALWAIVRPPRSATAGPRDLLAILLALASGLVVGALVVWWACAYFVVDAAQKSGEAPSLANAGANNAVKWYAFTTAVFLLGSAFVVWMYVRDTRTVRWFAAAPLALLRITVYGLLCGVFLLPAEQTVEETNKFSRVVILLDISPSMTDPKASDEIGSRAGKPRTRMDVLIEFLSDDKIALMKNLLEKNPVAVYAFGTRLDEAPTVVGRGEPAWAKGDWEAFARYDFKPFVLRGLTDAGKEQIRAAREWGDKPGTPDWAFAWFAQRTDKAEGDLKKFANLESDADVETLRKNLEKLDKRIDVARTIVLGTNVPDSVTAAINRESANMVQAVVVLSDGRSNLGSETSFGELRERATREKIPVFTIAVGEDRQQVAINITDVQAPDSAPIDEAWKVVVEADGPNLANRAVEVMLDLYMPGNTPPLVPDKNAKAVEPNETFRQTMVFAPGDPPHGQTEFVIDPAKLPAKLTTDSTDAAIKKRVLVEGKWAVRARIAKDPLETFPDPEHVSAVREVSVVQQKLRILLMASAPAREFAFLRTLLVREVQDKRAALTTFVQNEAGVGNKLTAEQDEQLIQRFPSKFDLKAAHKDDPEKAYNLNEYDVLIAFDPDWSELSLQQAEDLGRWVREGGGGIIYVAGPINTFQLARVEKDSRLDPLLKILPVQPADIIAQRIKPIPKTPRRLYLHPELIIGSDLLKLDDKVVGDPVAGWERFFSDREKYVPDADIKNELFPQRGFFSCYPLLQGQQAVERGLQENGVKPGGAVLAEFADIGDTGEIVKSPYLVTNNPSAAYRTCFVASGEFHKMRVYEPGEGTGREYFERVWIKLIKYMGGKRNVKAPRGRVLVGKEAVSGAPLRVQARVLNESAKAYDVAAPAPKFTIIQEPVGTGDRRSFGPFDLAPKPSPGGVFDGYYVGQVVLDPKTYAPGDSRYVVEIDVPDSAEKLTGEFKIRAADPEMDNKRPDFAAMLRMASEFDKDFEKRIPTKVAVELGQKLPKEGGVHRLAFRIGDTELLKLIPECVGSDKRRVETQGPVNDLWDRGVTLDLPRSRAVGVLYAIIGAALGLVLLRGLWAAIVSLLPGWLSTTVAVVWAGLNTVGLGTMLSLVLAGSVDPVDWVYSSAMFVLALVVLRAAWPVGVSIAGGVAALAVAALVYVEYSTFSGINFSVAVGLLLVVFLLSLEWLGRKLMRLA